MKHRIKRALFLLHRWFGIAMCLLFALWFASGVILMYVEYPELTEAERLDNLAGIDPGRISVQVGQAVAASRIEGGVTGLSLSAIGGRPAYRITGVSGDTRTLYADTGELFRSPSVEAVLESVAHSGFGTASGLRYDRAIEMDQWTVSFVLDKHRPLHKVLTGDDAGTVVYVSDTTGQIVRDTNRSERFWNWLGSTIHWIYPYQLRRHGELWADIVIWLSMAGMVSVVTGGIVGLMRLRIGRRYSGRPISPYRGVAKWHHVLGLTSVVFVGTFMFSGLMSMGPWGVFDSRTSPAEQIDGYTGGAIRSLAEFPAIDWSAFPERIKEVEWLQIAGRGHLVLSRSTEDREVVVDGRSGAPARRELRRRMQQAMPRFLPRADISGVDIIAEYDDYYYSRHNRYRPLPAYRVRFDDPESTWFHLDLSTGAVVTRHTDRSRMARWLFNGLHSLDFSFLLRAGPVWDVTVIALSVIGFAFSITSVVVGWRRLFGRKTASASGR